MEQLHFLLFLSSLLFLLYHLATKRNAKFKLPPGPVALPVFGNIHNMIGGPAHRRLARLAHIHGPLMHLKLGEAHYVIASSPSSACEILKTNDLAFASRPALLAIKTVAYDCAGMGFSPYGPHWRQLRRICASELLSTRRVRSFATVRMQEITRAVASIHASPSVDMTELFLQLTNNHLTCAAFGEECRSRGRFLKAMRETIELAPVLSLMDLFPSWGPLISMLDGKMGRMRRLHEEMDAVLDEIIVQHKLRKDAAMQTCSHEIQEDLVDVLLRVKDSGDLEVPLEGLHIKALILDLLVAATETTSSSLDWVMSELIRHPEEMRKVQWEIRGAAKEKQRINESDIEGCLYLKQVIKETLRLHPPLPLLLPRTCSESVDLLGFSLPSKTRVMVNAWAIGRDPNVWDNPESFQPERFKDAASVVDFKGGGFEYIPFGAGRRVCPGMTFALAGMELFLATLLFHFDWMLPDGRKPEELDMEEQFDGTLRKKNHLCLLAIPH